MFCYDDECLTGVSSHPYHPRLSAIMQLITNVENRYFSFTCELCCGLPAVKMLGTKKDYENIMNRLDKVDEMGVEAKAFVALLRPVIRQFIATFDAVKAGQEPNLEYWRKVCHVYSGGSGPRYLCGWLVAFCVWDADGKWQGPKSVLDAVRATEKGEKPVADAKTEIKEEGERTFDASIYGQIKLNRVPAGHAEVPVKLIDNEVEFDCMLVSGHVGARIGDSDVQENKVRDVLQPEPHWFFFEVQN